MAGSLDDKNVQLVDLANCVLSVLVYKDGSVQLGSAARTDDGDINHGWVAETLRRIADAEQEKHDGLR